jgi:hypothetical protein
MKKLIIISALSVVGYVGSDVSSKTLTIQAEEVQKTDSVLVVREEVIPPKPLAIDTLLIAMMWVESRFDSTAYAKNESAVGVLQIRPIMVREVNRLLKKMDKPQRYTLEDRWSLTKSVEMFNIIRDYHHKDSNYETIARCWNGGRRGDRKKSTEVYWQRVQLSIQNLNEILEK